MDFQIQLNSVFAVVARVDDGVVAVYAKASAYGMSYWAAPSVNGVKSQYFPWMDGLVEISADKAEKAFSRLTGEDKAEWLAISENMQDRLNLHAKGHAGGFMEQDFEGW